MNSYISGAEFNNLLEDWAGDGNNVADEEVAQTPAEMVIRIDDHVVIRQEVWYFCQFRNQSLLNGKYLTAAVLKDRAQLKAEYWEEYAIKKVGERSKKRLTALVHETADMVVKQ